MFRFAVWKSLFYSLTRKTSYRKKANARTFGMQGGFPHRGKIPPSSGPYCSQTRTSAGFQVVLISTTVIFVVASSGDATPLSPPTGNNYFRWQPTRRTRNSFSSCEFAHAWLAEMELLSCYDYIDWIIKNIHCSEFRSACCNLETAAVFQCSRQWDLFIVYR